MKGLLIAAAAGAALLTSACADDYYGPRHLHGPSYAAYYDDAYGPIYSGRWDSDGFYYRTAPDGAWIRDGGNHFRRDAYNGYHGMNLGADGRVGVGSAGVGIGVRP